MINFDLLNINLEAVSKLVLFKKQGRLSQDNRPFYLYFLIYNRTDWHRFERIVVDFAKKSEERLPQLLVNNRLARSLFLVADFKLTA